VTFLRASARVLGAAALACLCACGGSTGASGPTASLTLLPSATTVRNDGVPVTILASAVTAAGTPGTGTVTFVAAFGNLTNSAGAPASTVTLAADGTASINYACNIAVDSRCVAGNVFVSGSWSSAGKTVQLSVSNVAPPAGGGPPPPPAGGGGTPPPPTGTPPGPPSNIAVTSSAPSVLGLKGSGIQERGTISYLVSDSLGIPAPGITVNFAVQAPVLGITLLKTSAVSDLNGVVTAAYTSGSEVGVSGITATVSTTGATVTRAVAVRGAKPSASGFYFRCEKANLPVYTSTPWLESMTCTIRLADRFGNRVGVATPVRLATEAGTISASVTTKPFDFANPSDPNEGSATVTFSTDMGNGSAPADVDPLVAAPTQFPWPRQLEPRVSPPGFLTRNPRDQFVTIIAMTEGEEAFVDANHNGLLDNNEVFYDLGDPFIDANDDNAYGQIYTGGPWEVRFCGINADCSTYRGPNGLWDSLTTIWVPTWVVFTGVVAPSTSPAGGTPPPTNDYKGVCITSTVPAFADIYVYDTFLNTPAAGVTYKDPAIEKTDVKALLTAKKHGFFTQLDSWGGMGQLGFDFDYRPVSTTGGLCAAPASPTAPTPCVMRLLFRAFEDGFRGTIEVDSTGGATCPTTAPPKFTTSLEVDGAHGSFAVGTQIGTFTP